MEKPPLPKMRLLSDADGNLAHFAFPLEDPNWLRVEQASHMRLDDPVLGLLFSGKAWALPWWIMKNHHVANLVLNDRPILVTLCERCSSAAAFDPVINGQRHTFHVAGAYNGTILPIDHETESLWAAFTGESIHGPLKGAVMLRLPLVQCTWQEWIAAYPGTLVPDGEGESRDGHGSGQSPGSPDKNFRRVVRHVDERLPHNELVLGVKVDGCCRCYPLPGLAKYGHVLNDTLGGQEIAVFCKPQSWMAIAFLRTLDGECLRFKTDQDAILDENTGSQWDMSGLAVSGSLGGRQLEYVNSGVEEFYVWAAFNPETEIHGHDGMAEILEKNS